MDRWKSVLNADPTEWLLEPDNPSVRYYTLVHLLERSTDDEEVRQAKLDIMSTGTVPEILSKQNEDGFWGDPKKFYTDKYKGTSWQLLILAELGADGSQPLIARACQLILDHSQEAASGGFAVYRSEKTGWGLPGYVVPCLTGNMVWSLIRLGYLDDERVKKGIAWIDAYQRFDDGVEVAPTGWPYDKYEMCWGKHSCHLGVVKALKALAAIPSERRSETTQKTIDQGGEYLLKHHIYKRSHDLSSVSRQGWLRFGFPLMYQSDILEILLILTRLNYHDERMQDAINMVVAKQDPQGRWKMENSFNGKTQVNIETKGKPSKWLTLNSLRVLKSWYGE